MVAADPSYRGLTRYAETAGATVRAVPLDAAMGHDLPAMAAAVTDATRLVYICNPNNPTGTALAPDALRAFCERVSRRAVVFVDEAYLDLVADPALGASMGDLVRAGHDVIVARTFSKVHGMAGMRIGYGIARPELAARLRAVGMGGPNVVAMRAAGASLDDPAFLEASRAGIRAARAFTYAALDAAGYPYVRSHGNFVFFDTGQPVERFSAAMRAHGRARGAGLPALHDVVPREHGHARRHGRLRGGPPEHRRRIASFAPLVPSASCCWKRFVRVDGKRSRWSCSQALPGARWPRRRRAGWTTGLRRPTGTAPSACPTTGTSPSPTIRARSSTTSGRAPT